MTEPIDHSPAEDVEFLEVIHEMQDTANYTINTLERLVEISKQNGVPVTLNTESVEAICKLIRYQETVVTRLTEENFTQRDMARDVLGKMQELTDELKEQEIAHERDGTTASG